MNKKDIYETLSKVQDNFRTINWIVGGSAALVLQGYLEEANDIDIIQHTKSRVLLDGDHENRMWSKFYYDLSVDLHFSSIDHIDEYEKCFHKIVHALYYIDNIHVFNHEGYSVVTPKGAGLINWVHHFLPYGYNDQRTLIPEDKDQATLMSILGAKAYKTIQWNVETSQIEFQQTSEDFKKFSEHWEAEAQYAAL